MILGIKVGPQTQSLKDLEDTNAPFAEVWYQAQRESAYTDVFDELKKRQMQVGLHFWGHTSDGILANLAYPNKEVINQSLAMMQATIATAARHHFQYVNIHPSHAALLVVDYEKEEFRLTSEPCNEKIYLEHFFENLNLLNDYAKKHGVVLTIETVPYKDYNDWSNPESRLHPVYLHAPPNSLLVKASVLGFTIANDFGHTSCSTISDNRDQVWQQLRSTTIELLPQTRLIHSNFIVPPYNGTDFHAHLDKPAFETDQCLPNRSEMLELLSLFKDRADVWVLTEPDGRHTENYFYLKQMIDEM